MTQTSYYYTIATLRNIPESCCSHGFACSFQLSWSAGRFELAVHASYPNDKKKSFEKYPQMSYQYNTHMQISTNVLAV